MSAPPPWWYIIGKRMADRLASLTPARTKRGPIDDAVETIMNYIYERLDKQMQRFNNNIDIDLGTPQNAAIFLALLFIDICHDAGADNVIKRILAAPRARTGVDGFKAYINKVEFVHPGIKRDIINAIPLVAPLVNNSVYMNNKGIFITDEHQAFCETGALMRRTTPGSPEFKVFNQDVLSLINFISNEDTVRGGVFDQSSAGTVLQTMGLMKIRPIVAIPNVADQGLNIQLNPTIPTNFGYVTEIFKNLVMKSPKEFSKIGRYTLGPSAYWMAQNDPNLDLGQDEATSYSAELPCSLIELLDLMRTPGQGNLNQEKLSVIVQYLFNEKDGLLKYLETIGFFNSESCTDSKALFENLKRSNGIMDNNESWASTIRVGDKTILEVQYEGDENEGIISRVKVFDRNGNMGFKEESVISASSAAAASTITDTIFKTIGDNNMFLYALANGAWAMTGDKVAASQYLLLSYLLESGSATVYVNENVFEGGAKFIFESAKPSQNRLILFESRKNNPIPLLTAQTPLVDITTTDYCLGKVRAADGTIEPRPQTGFLDIIRSVIESPQDTGFGQSDGLYVPTSVQPTQYTKKQLRRLEMGVGTAGSARAAQFAAQVGVQGEAAQLEGLAGGESQVPQVQDPLEGMFVPRGRRGVTPPRIDKEEGEGETGERVRERERNARGGEQSQMGGYNTEFFTADTTQGDGEENGEEVTSDESIVMNAMNNARRRANIT